MTKIMALIRTSVLLAAAGTAAFTQGQIQNPDLEEVRIRSAIYAPPPALTISVESSLVEVAATVRDRKGQPAGGFKADDFELFDNGVRQQITAFSESSAAQTPAAVRPRYLALFFDDSHTGSVGIERTRKAAQKLIDTALQPAYRLGIFTDSGSVTLDFTNDKTALLAALARLRPHPYGVRPTIVCPALTPLDAYVIAKHLDLRIKERAVAQAIACNCPPPSDTSKNAPVDPAYQDCVNAQINSVQVISESFWDMIRPQSVETIESMGMIVRHLARAPGDRVLILVSSGVLSGGLDQMIDSLVETAIRSHVVINTLHAEGLSPARNAALATQVYTQFHAAAASGTGGQLVRNTNDFIGGLHTLAALPAVSYLLGFSPQSEPDNALHTLKLRLNHRSGFQVDARPGYYSEAAHKTETVQQRIDREAAADGTLVDFPAFIRLSQGDGKIRIDVQVDIRDFRFLELAGRSMQQLTFVTVLRDSSGNYVSGKQAVMDLALTPAKLAEFRAGGIRTAVTFDAPKGSYQVREIVREAGQNRMAASTIPIDVR